MNIDSKLADALVEIAGLKRSLAEREEEIKRLKEALEDAILRIQCTGF